MISAFGGSILEEQSISKMWGIVVVFEVLGSMRWDRWSICRIMNNLQAFVHVR